MKTLIYACYLPGSERPDYIGSHNAEAPDRSAALKWRYANMRYLGQGAWIDKETGVMMRMPRINRSTLWGARLLTMSPAAMLSIRVEILAEVDAGERWRAEAAAIREHKPPFNTMCVNLPDTKAEKRAKLNAYQKKYMPIYLATHPEFAARKREADKLRNRAKRAAAKEARILVK